MQEIGEQNTTDFEKAVILIQSIDPRANIIALNCFGGRLDHSLSVLNVAKKYETLNFQLVNEKCLAIIIRDVNSLLYFIYL